MGCGSSKHKEEEYQEPPRLTKQQQSQLANQVIRNQAVGMGVQAFNKKTNNQYAKFATEKNATKAADMLAKGYDKHRGAGAR